MHYDELQYPEPMGPTFCRSRQNIALGQSKWGIRNLRWAVLDAPPTVDARSEMSAALAAVSAVCNLSFEESDARDANLILSTGRGSRADFDGPGGVLAWFQLPAPMQTSGACLGRLDLDDFKPNRTIRERNVIRHELGHGLGLPHLRPGSLMQPTYDAAIETYGPVDIAALQFLYGPPKAERPVDPVNPDPNQLADLFEAQRVAILQSIATALSLPAEYLNREARSK